MEAPLRSRGAGVFVMTRLPQPGQTKTRLIPALGAVGAAHLQRQMTEHVLGRLAAIGGALPITVEVHFTGGTLAQMRDWLGPHLALQPQCEGDLGQRLAYALAQGLAAGFSPILMVASDCPGIAASHIEQAVRQLEQVDVVLGPATDGGYYLIGLNQLQPWLFEGIAWGQASVLAQTIAIARQHALTVALLSPLGDIDRPEDLSLWEAYRDESSRNPQVRL